MVNFGPVAAEVGPVVWGTPANFNGFGVLAALLHGTPVVGVSLSSSWLYTATKNIIYETAPRWRPIASGHW